MPTIFTHAIAAGAVASTCRFGRKPTAIVAVAAASAVLPDADVVAFGLGIPYGDLFGHRGLTHSLPFAAAWATLVTALYVRTGWRAERWRLWTLLLVATASHGLLDALTDGGRGVAIFAPFDDTRIFWPWRPIAVSPIGGRFFTARAADGGYRWVGVLVTEVVWVWLPALATVAASRVWRGRRETRPR